ncbi:ras-related protein Rab-20-like isoform X2 [Pomacea canaliculata]|uniref:ras-related protein Rab-20-like isoform X2 n=1 Tax=Pomacea canaliculata TaxID=400727 RepID=UPI000D72B309|nr:ras-related protein Rab-20-like isoform X2 [Pomacea canaliculata]
MSTKQKADLKVIILGDYNVGKTSLICRYIEGKFRGQEPDTAGDEKYSGLSHFYCRSAGAAILAYDINDPKTFESLWARFSPMLSAANDDCMRVIVATKSDLLEPGSREITVDEGKRLAREFNAHIDLTKVPFEPYFETSSKLGTGVTEVFEYIFQHCLPLSDEQKKRHTDIIDLVDAPRGQDKTKCSC